MRNAFINELHRLAAADERIFLLAGDLGFGVLDKFRQDYPDRFINAGVAEQNMTAVAAGLALEGRTVFTYSIGNFTTLRCLEQIRNCVAYHGANVKVISVGAGLSYGALGVTHHATEDLSIMRALPNMMVFSPADALEAVAIAKAVCEVEGACYIRLGKGRESLIHQRPIEGYEIGRAIKIFAGDDARIFSTGAIAFEALKAAESLRARGLSVGLYTFPTIKPIDRGVIEECARRCRLLVTVEENNIVSGFGSAVAEIISELDGRVAMLRRIGLRDEFASIVGSQEFLRRQYRLTREEIFALIEIALTDGGGGRAANHLVKYFLWDYLLSAFAAAIIFDRRAREQIFYFSAEVMQ